MAQYDKKYSRGYFILDWACQNWQNDNPTKCVLENGVQKWSCVQKIQVLSAKLTTIKYHVE